MKKKKEKELKKELEEINNDDEVTSGFGKPTSGVYDVFKKGFKAFGVLG